MNPVEVLPCGDTCSKSLRVLASQGFVKQQNPDRMTARIQAPPRDQETAPG
jgi:hypothetical protein